MTTRPRALHLLQELDILQDRLRELDITLSRADSAASGLMLDELLLAEKRVGGTEEKLKIRQDYLKTVRGQLVTFDRERRRILEAQLTSATSEHLADLARRAAQALADYETRLLEHKVSQLRGEFVRRFNHLARKADWIADVRIDMTNFAATLIDRNGQEVPKAALSAGEKQVYAIAMLWALAGTSGRALPMIIDTPLARLDSDHRSNLVERYFPVSSHQVILLSTDTEVDEQLLAALNKSVSHSYRLDYDPIAQKTFVSRGYFEASSRETEQRRAI
jgi:DNA sulfur modification protein DndD